MTILQSLGPGYQVRIGLDTVNRLELFIGSRSVWGTNERKMIAYSDEKRAGMVNLSVKPVTGGYRNNTVDNFSLGAWETAAEALRFSLDGKEATEKCWNCFEEKDFRANFCRHCGKS